MSVVRTSIVLRHICTHFSVSHPYNKFTLFQVSFEFRHALHSQLSAVFFDTVVKEMVNSFLKRAKQKFGAPSIRAQKPKVLIYNS